MSSWKDLGGPVHTTEVVGLRTGAGTCNWKYFFELLQDFVPKHCGAFVSAAVQFADGNFGDEIIKLAAISEFLNEDETLWLRFAEATVAISFVSGWRHLGVANGQLDWSLEFGFWVVEFDRRVNDPALDDAEAESDLIALWTALLPAVPCAAAAGEELCLISDWEAILAGHRSLMSRREWCIAVVAKERDVDEKTEESTNSRAIEGGRFFRRAFLFKDCYNRQ